MLRHVIAVSMLWFPAAAMAEEVTVAITAKDCARLLRHQPAADVAYQPGVGVRGRKVAPADLPGSGNTMNVLPEIFEIPITISPVGWAERNAANKAKGAAEKGLATTYSDKKAAETELAALTTSKTTLDTEAVSLAADLATLNADKAALVAQQAVMENEITLGTRSAHDRFYVRKKKEVAAKDSEITTKQANITANTDAVTANVAAQAVQQTVIDAAPGKEAGYSAAKSGAESSLSALSARGLDEATMKVGTFKYDTMRGTFTFNDQPMGSAEQQAMAEACAKRGVK